MRPGRRPAKDPIEQEARAKLRESAKHPPIPARPPPSPKRKSERWR